MSIRQRQHGDYAIEQRHAFAKRVLLGPLAPAARAWAGSGTPTAAKATVMRRLVVPPVGAAAKEFEAEVQPGFRFSGNTKDLLGLMVHLLGVWEPNLSTFIQRRLRSGDTFIDVGANSGWFTCMAAHLVGPTGTVVAIEASPTIARRLQANIDRNGFVNTRMLVAAVLSEQGMVDVVPGPAEHTGLTHVSTDHDPSGIQVPGDALPVLLREEEIAQARIVKIDVEGAEFDVVAGLADALEHFSPECEFVVEVGPERAAQPHDVETLIGSFVRAGYVPYALPNFYDVRSYMLRPVTTSLPRLIAPPTRETDIVFSRHGGETLTL